MKPINTMMFITNATEEFTAIRNNIWHAETYENAREYAMKAIGFADAMITFNNTMTCMENNDFTNEFCEVLQEWYASVYQELSRVAIKFGQDDETVAKLREKRDWCKEQ